jgi:hypothetical protein
LSTFLETLKERLVDAQRRMQIATSTLQSAQAQHQAITQELTSWSKAVEVETRREQSEMKVRAYDASLLSAASEASASTVTLPPATTGAPVPEPPKINKTEVVRELLRQHATGMKPVEVWKATKDKIPQRAYVYAVLKRLKDSDEVTIRRGKYFARMAVKPEETKPEQSSTTTVH